MTTHKNDPWWHIFSDNNPRPDNTCPVVPVDSGQSWQKGLASFYCPCNYDPQANECQLPLM